MIVCSRSVVRVSPYVDIKLRVCSVVIYLYSQCNIRVVKCVYMNFVLTKMEYNVSWTMVVGK